MCVVHGAGAGYAVWACEWLGPSGASLVPTQHLDLGSNDEVACCLLSLACYIAGGAVLGAWDRSGRFGRGRRTLCHRGQPVLQAKMTSAAVAPLIMTPWRTSPLLDLLGPTTPVCRGNH
jgi:hypothetical protein